MNLLNKLEEFEKECAVDFLSHSRYNFYNRLYYHNSLDLYIEHRFKEAIEDFVEIIGIDNNDIGVYKIGNFYIGQSKNLKKRFAQHLVQALYEPNKISNLNRKPLNKEKIGSLRDSLRKGKLIIEILDTDLTKEGKYVNESELELTNKVSKDKKAFEEKKKPQVGKLYPIYYKDKKWSEEEVDDIFRAYYHTQFALDYQTSVYVGDKMRITPDGEWFEE